MARLVVHPTPAAIMDVLYHFICYALPGETFVNTHICAQLPAFSGICGLPKHCGFCVCVCVPWTMFPGVDSSTEQGLSFALGTKFRLLIEPDTVQS